jgi:hypothetical protein
MSDGSGHGLRFFCRIFSEKIDVRLVAEDAVTLAASDFAKNAEIAEQEGDEHVES